MNQSSIKYVLLVAGFVFFRSIHAEIHIAKPTDSVMPVFHSNVNLLTGAPLVKLSFGLILQGKTAPGTSSIPAGANISSEWDMTITELGGIPSLTTRSPYFVYQFVASGSSWVPIMKGTGIRQLTKMSDGTWYLYFTGQPSSIYLSFAASNGLVYSFQERTRNTSLTRDTLGRITQIMDPDGNRTTYAYDLTGRLSSIVTKGKTYSFTYDSLGNLIAINGGCGAILTIAYVKTGVPAHLYWHPSLEGVAFTYFTDDSVKETYSVVVGSSGPIRNGNPIVFSYPNAQSVTVTEFDGSTTYSFGGASHKPILSIISINVSVTYNYPLGSLDHLPNVVTQVISPSTNVSPKPSTYSESFTWNSFGNLLTRDSGGVRQESNAYNSIGQLTVNTLEGVGSFSYIYDSYFKLLSVTNGPHKRTYFYDFNGYINKITDGGTRTYYESTNDFWGRPLSVTDSDGAKTTISYTPGVQGYLGVPMYVTYPDGASKTLSITPDPYATYFTQTFYFGNTDSPVSNSWIEDCREDITNSSDNFGFSSWVSVTNPTATQTKTTHTTLLGNGRNITFSRTTPGSHEKTEATVDGNLTCESSVLGSEGPEEPPPTCSPSGVNCGNGCCTGLTCCPDGKCGNGCPLCGGVSAPCTANSDCCADTVCSNFKCTASCVPGGGSCTEDSNCCSGAKCCNQICGAAGCGDGGGCINPGQLPSGSVCNGNGECCSNVCMIDYIGNYTYCQ